MNDFRRLIETAQSVIDGIPLIEEVFLPLEVDDAGLLLEGLWVDGRFKRNIRIDRPTHLGGEGDPHAHVYGRKRDEIVVVNKDGTGSHGSKGRLHSHDANALRARGWTIRSDNIVEWHVVAAQWQVLPG